MNEWYLSSGPLGPDAPKTHVLPSPILFTKWSIEFSMLGCNLDVVELAKGFVFIVHFVGRMDESKSTVV